LLQHKKTRTLFKPDFAGEGARLRAEAAWLGVAMVGPGTAAGLGMGAGLDMAMGPPGEAEAITVAAITVAVVP